jgi:hypothetical protein
MGLFDKPLKKSERDAAARAQEILKRADRDAHPLDRQYEEHGAGKLTKDQKKSQESYIPFTEGPRTRGQKIARKFKG